MSAVIEWLARLEDGVVLSWGQDLDASHGVLTNYVDVFIPEICRDIGWNWLWTIEGPEETDENYCVIRVDCDVLLWRNWDKNKGWWVTDPCVVSEIGTPIDLGNYDGLSEASSELGWRAGTISRALRQWCREHVGKDISFVYDATICSDVVKHVKGIVERAEAGAPTYEIGPGIHASSEVMDALLSMEPDKAAGISGAAVGTLGRVIKTIRGREEPGGPHGLP